MFKKQKYQHLKKKKLYGAPVISNVLSQVQEKKRIKPTLKEISQWMVTHTLVILSC